MLMSDREVDKVAGLLTRRAEEQCQDVDYLKVR